jgi:hypothetical protein
VTEGANRTRSFVPDAFALVIASRRVTAAPSVPSSTGDVTVKSAADAGAAAAKATMTAANAYV